MYTLCGRPHTLLPFFPKNATNLSVYDGANSHADLGTYVKRTENRLIAAYDVYGVSHANTGGIPQGSFVNLHGILAEVAQQTSQ